MNEELTEPTPTRPDPGEMEPDSTFGDLWGWLREKFPPARAILVLIGLGAPFLSALNTWLLNHLPFIAEQINGDDLKYIWAAGVAALVTLAYKWLDGQAKWEGGQISARVALAQANKLSSEEAQAILDPPPRRRRRRDR